MLLSANYKTEVSFCREMVIVGFQSTYGVNAIPLLTQLSNKIFHSEMQNALQKINIIFFEII